MIWMKCIMILRIGHLMRVRNTNDKVSAWENSTRKQHKCTWSKRTLKLIITSHKQSAWCFISNDNLLINAYMKSKAQFSCRCLCCYYCFCCWCISFELCVASLSSGSKHELHLWWDRLNQPQIIGRYDKFYMQCMHASVCTLSEWEC